ncbi:hypothetical protein OTB20_19505 [Streptomyces sp. H27-H1]|uniref:hypothetical protein n=1 Tax=Streptomyces sp. H27-H1 TaxID=2996461 RepID=UPI00226F35BB|nr:hypothetical protein [Streptomyces sp. H27-H1]MCY0928344.1 hypothetical protein [Streptomyces sp. H27-H1]
MTDIPTLRDQAIDAAKQAINTLGMWLPPAGREAVVDAVLALSTPAACCVCGGGPVTYRNYREQPFCWPCADCQCGENPCIRTGGNDPAVSAEATGYCPHCGRGDAGPTADQYDASQRRTVRIQRLLDDTRDRSHKDAAASRESERQLQQQIDAQAKEIDRLRDELAALHEGEEEPAGPRHPAPTPAEWLWSWNRGTPAQRLEQVGRIIDAGMRAGTCFQADHESVIQRLRADRAAVDRVRTQLDAIEFEGQARNPYDRDPVAELGRIRSALHQPRETRDA